MNTQLLSISGWMIGIGAILLFPIYFVFKCRYYRRVILRQKQVAINRFVVLSRLSELAMRQKISAHLQLLQISEGRAWERHHAEIMLGLAEKGVNIKDGVNMLDLQSQAALLGVLDLHYSSSDDNQTRAQVRDQRAGAVI